MTVEQARHLLGVNRGAGPDEIKRAFRRQAKLWHPDRWNGDPVGQSRAAERMKQLNEAFGILRDHRETVEVEFGPTFAAPRRPPPPRPSPLSGTPVWKAALIVFVLAQAAGIVGRAVDLWLATHADENAPPPVVREIPEPYLSSIAAHAAVPESVKTPTGASTPP